MFLQMGSLEFQLISDQYVYSELFTLVWKTFNVLFVYHYFDKIDSPYGTLRNHYFVAKAKEQTRAASVLWISSLYA